MTTAKLERVVQFMNGVLGIPEFPDYPNALNGLQVENRGEVSRIGAAVDATEASIEAARARGIDLLLVHHGLFWAGVRPVIGPEYRKLSQLLGAGMALYSAHLPLDAHPELGNCAVLARELGLEPAGPFGAFKGTEIGWWGTTEIEREDLRGLLADRLGDQARLIPGGPKAIRRVAVVTGGGASFLAEAAASEMDALITGEAPHHAYHEAIELGVNLYLGGHYATETWGVRALAERIADEFQLPWEFLDLPTGL